MRIPIDEIKLNFVRASGPGGQNVNKVATAVELRFDARNSPSLTEPARARLQTLAGKRITLDGVLLITAQARRTQEGNRTDAIARLEELVERAYTVPKKRRATRPSKAAKARRLDEKSQRSSAKKLRGRPGED